MKEDRGSEWAQEGNHSEGVPPDPILTEEGRARRNLG